MKTTFLKKGRQDPELTALKEELQNAQGDLSLAYWRDVHERFFKADMAASGLVFDEDMPVVCERFRLVWPEKGGRHA